jgi:hypothetical protein
MSHSVSFSFSVAAPLANADDRETLLPGYLPVPAVRSRHRMHGVCKVDGNAATRCAINGSEQLQQDAPSDDCLTRSARRRVRAVLAGL